MADFGTIQFQEAEALRKRVAELEARVAELESMLHSTKALLDEVAQAAGFRTGDSYSADAIIKALRT